MAEGRAGALEDYATAAFSVSGVKQDISLEDWKGGWASIVGGLRAILRRNRLWPCWLHTG